MQVSCRLSEEDLLQSHTTTVKLYMDFFFCIFFLSYKHMNIYFMYFSVYILYVWLLETTVKHQVSVVTLSVEILI